MLLHVSQLWYRCWQHLDIIFEHSSHKLKKQNLYGVYVAHWTADEIKTSAPLRYFDHSTRAFSQKWSLVVVFPPPAPGHLFIIHHRCEESHQRYTISGGTGRLWQKRSLRTSAAAPDSKKNDVWCIYFPTVEFTAEDKVFKTTFCRAQLQFIRQPRISISE